MLGIGLTLVIVVVLGLLALRAYGLPPFSATTTPPSGPSGPGEPAADRTLTLVGSGTLGEQLTPDLVDAFLRERGATDVRRESTEDRVTVLGTLPGDPEPTSIEVVSTGTASAFTGLRGGSADIGMASREITEDERAELTGRGDLSGVESEHVVALDAVAVIVNRDRDLSTASLEQLRDIYSCRITDWSQLGQPAGPIRALALREGSGTLDTFRETVLDGQDVCPSVERIGGVEEISRAVSADRAAISFVSLPFARYNTTLALSSGDSRPQQPTQLDVATESYPLTRRLYFYLPTLPGLDPLASDLVEFVLGPAGQQLVNAAGFVSPLYPPTPPTAEPCQADLPDYCELVNGAERVPLDVRFDSDSDSVDSRAFRFLELFAQQLTAPENGGREVLLVGFTDNAGSEQDNLALSKGRAESVARELAGRGVRLPVEAVGFGEAVPVATNDTLDGREQNRRVEIWLR
jgi:phosphate transport system substrate-binding protein